MPKIKWRITERTTTDQRGHLGARGNFGEDWRV